MTELEAIMSATSITDVVKPEDISEKIALNGNKPFRLFLAPQSGSEFNVGDVVTVTGTLPQSAVSVEVPVAVGSWSPVLFTVIDGIELAKIDAYIAPIKYYKE